MPAPASKTKKFTVINPDPAILEWIPGADGDGTTNAVVGGWQCLWVRQRPSFLLKDRACGRSTAYKSLCLHAVQREQGPRYRGNDARPLRRPGHMWAVCYGQRRGPYDTINVVTIDQWGLGRSLPSFLNEDCRFLDIEPKDEWNFGRSFPPSISPLYPTPAQQLLMRRFLRGAKDRIISCYSHKELIMKSKGNNNSWNCWSSAGR